MIQLALAGLVEADSSLRRLQTIADAGLRQNVLWPRRVWLDFVSELAHIDAKILGVNGRSPKFLKQEPMGEHLSRMLHHEAQQLVFLRRELHLFTAHLDDAPDQIDGKIVKLKDRPFALNL